jgi:hypothetical protein
MKKITPFTTLLILLVIQCFSSQAENNKSRHSEEIRDRHKNDHRLSFVMNENLKSVGQYKYKLDSIIETDYTGEENHAKFLYYIDDNNFIEEEIEYLWDKENKSWIKDYGYTFEKEGNLLNDYYWYWDDSTKEWYNDYACVSYYNDKGQIEEKGYYKWNSEKETWDNDYYDIISYRDDGGVLLWIEYKWSTETSEWITYGKWEYAYENNNLKNLQDIIQTMMVLFIYMMKKYLLMIPEIRLQNQYIGFGVMKTKQLEKDSKYVCTWNKDVAYSEIVLPFTL